MCRYSVNSDVTVCRYSVNSDVTFQLLNEDIECPTATKLYNKILNSPAIRKEEQMNKVGQGSNGHLVVIKHNWSCISMFSKQSLAVCVFTIF